MINLNINLISKYINNLTKKDIISFAKKENISLEDFELDIIYFYIKNKYNEFLNGRTIEILNEIKSKIKPNTYKVIENLYLKYKIYLN